MLMARLPEKGAIMPLSGVKENVQMYKVVYS